MCNTTRNDFVTKFCSALSKSSFFGKNQKKIFNRFYCQKKFFLLGLKVDMSKHRVFVDLELYIYKYSHFVYIRREKSNLFSILLFSLLFLKSISYSNLIIETFF